MIIREALVDEAEPIWLLHSRSVRGLCQKAYTPQQIEAWINGKNVDDYRERIRNHPSFVAEQDGRLVGYARYYPNTSELCSIFVSPDCARQGIGRQLVQRLCWEATAAGLKYLWLDASLNAVPFYEALGFTAEKEIPRQFGGIPFAAVRMSKPL